MESQKFRCQRLSVPVHNPSSIGTDESQFSRHARLPVLLLLVIGTSVHRAVADARPGRNSWLCLATIFSLGLLPKIILRVGWAHYGFALAMPGTLVIVHVAVHTIPDWWRERRHSDFLPNG